MQLISPLEKASAYRAAFKELNIPFNMTIEVDDIVFDFDLTNASVVCESLDRAIELIMVAANLAFDYALDAGTVEGKTIYTLALRARPS